MASVFKTKDRRGKAHAVWRFKYRGVDGKWKYGTGWPDKKKTLDHALTVEAECRAIRKGEKAAPAAWLKNRNKPITDIVEEYLNWGKASGGWRGFGWATAHAANRKRVLEWWIEKLSLKTMAGIELSKVEVVLQELQLKLATKTVAAYAEAIAALCDWSVDRSYLMQDSLAALRSFKTEPKEPHRELSAEELNALFAVAPANRALWYRVALATGYRQNELRKLTVRTLDRFGPALPLAAEFCKNRKDANQPISRALARISHHRIFSA